MRSAKEQLRALELMLTNDWARENRRVLQAQDDGNVVALFYHLRVANLAYSLLCKVNPLAYDEAFVIAPQNLPTFEPEKASASLSKNPAPDDAST